MAVGSFSAGLSGLNANAAYLSVIGNNLANINTVGYKSSSVSFQDLVAQTVSGSSINPMQIGLGVMVGSVSPVFTQGSIENARDPTNVAIQGSGFFVVGGPGGETGYTRAGNFSFDANGALVTPDGWKVQGWSTTDATTGLISSSGVPSDIVVPPGVLRAPTETTQFGMTTNLNASAAVNATLTTAVQIYDALGQTHTLNVTYTKTAANNWGFKVEVEGGEVTGGTAGTPFSLATGTITFAADGTLSAVAPAAPATGGGAVPAAIAAVSFTTPVWLSGAPASALKFNMVDATGEATFSGYSAASATSTITQNGSAASMIDNLSVTADGTIFASGSGGQKTAIAQLALASFTNPKGLSKLGANRYSSSSTAGVANVGVPGTGGRGSIIGSALEQSNVDIAQEFTQMILAQRGYQANAKTITVSDEMLQDTLNLKR
jgi:flagellar hook protein FlgE